MGLDYGYKHLQDDGEKLAYSDVQHPYLVHLSRRPSGYHEATERVIADITKQARIAFARHDLDRGTVHFKHLADPGIADEEYPASRVTRNPRAQATGPA